MTETDPRHQIEHIESEDGNLRIDWADGHSSLFHAIWLRHQCECATCGTPVNAVRGIRLHHLEDRPEFTITSSESDAVELTWLADGHVSKYQADWLRGHCYSDAERTRRRHLPTFWDHRIGNDLPVADMVACERSPEARLGMLEAAHDLGFCKIVNAPTVQDEASRLIELVGPQRQSHYGTYTLTNKDRVDNVGDITDALPPHTDETYRLSTIGITVFQVLKPAKVGGHSTLVDGFEAVRRLRESYPDDFDLLTRVPITGVRRDTAFNSGGNEKWYAATMPAIRVDLDGDVTGVRLNERQIMPLSVSGDLVEPTYRAMRRLYQILYDPELLLTFDLKAGEGLIFDNQRVLHGRTAFEPCNPPRSVLTSSVDIEEFHSSLRMLTLQVRGEVPGVEMRQGMVR